MNDWEEGGKEVQRLCQQYKDRAAAVDCMNNLKRSEGVQ